MGSVIISIKGNMPLQIVVEDIKAWYIILHFPNQSAEHFRDQVFTAESECRRYLMQLSCINYLEASSDKLAGARRNVGDIKCICNRTPAPEQLQESVNASGISAALLHR